MRTGWELAPILLGLTLGAAAATWLRTRLPRVAVIALLVASGAAIGAGALLLQSGASGVEWALTLAVLGAMTPFQARLVFGRLGETAEPPSGTVVPD